MLIIAQTGAWKLAANDSDFLGWATTAGYLLTTLLCARAALANRKSTGTSEVRIWSMLALLTALLGINKQLDFQTLLIETGRSAAKSEGWFEHRRLVQLLFVAVTAIVFLSSASWAFRRHWSFIGRHRALSAGILVMLCYCFLRSADINHVQFSASHRSGNHTWLSIIELAGVTTAAAGAFRASCTVPPGRPIDRTPAP